MSRSYLVGVVIGLIVTVFYVSETLGEKTIKLNDFTCFPENAATKVTVGAEGVTLTRIISGIDAGCEFHPEGKDIPLDSNHSRIEFQPVRSINRGYYVVTITFRGQNNRWAEHDWIRDIGEPRSTNLQVLPDVLHFANERGVAGMDHYFLKIRIQPQTFAGKRPAFVFSRISIGPVRVHPN